MNELFIEQKFLYIVRLKIFNPFSLVGNSEILREIPFWRSRFRYKIDFIDY